MLELHETKLQCDHCKGNMDEHSMGWCGICGKYFCSACAIKEGVTTFNYYIGTICNKCYQENKKLLDSINERIQKELEVINQLEQTIKDKHQFICRIAMQVPRGKRVTKHIRATESSSMINIIKGA